MTVIQSPFKYNPASVPANPVTYTGSAALQSILAGPTVFPYAGMAWQFDVWGQVTTTLGTDSVNWQVVYGGIGGVVLGSTGAEVVNGGGAVTGATVRYKGTVQFNSVSTSAVAAQVDQNYFPQLVAQNTASGLAASGQLVIGKTANTTAVSLTINGGFWQQVN